MNFTYVDQDNSAKIKVIGVGNEGGNAINSMIDSNLSGVQFIVANTDSHSLAHSKAKHKIQLKGLIKKRYGEEDDPNIGEKAAHKSENILQESLANSHLVFIITCLDDNTETGVAPVIAKICRDLGALTVAVVTDPFSFEQRRKSQQTKEGIVKLTDIADMVITIPISRLSKLKSKKAAAIKKSDEVILYSVKGITDLIMRPGLINLDFADVKAIISKAGLANIGIGISTGANRALEASEKAIYHPLLRNNSIVGAKSVLMNITCNSDMTMDEITEASERIYNEIDDDNVEIIWGTVVDDSLGDELRVTVIAIGTGGGEVQMAISPKTIKTSNKDHYPQAGYDIPTFLRKKEK